MMANVLNRVIPWECKDIFIHNKSKRNYYTLFHYLITLFNTPLRKIVVRDLLGHILSDRGVPFLSKLHPSGRHCLEKPVISVSNQVLER